MKTKLFAFFLISAVFVSTAHAQANSWTNLTAGTFKWETGSNWSLGAPPSAGQEITITNRAVAAPHENRQKTIEIDSTTASSFPGTMTVNNLTVLAPTGNQNTLFLNNAGSTALTVANALIISNQGVLQVTGSTLLATNLHTQFNIGFLAVLDDGIVSLDTGTMNTANTAIGYADQGNFTVTAGAWLANNVYLGSNPGSQGTLTLAGGSYTLATLQIGVGTEATGTVWITGGDLVVVDGINIGGEGFGSLIQSNGIVSTFEEGVGGGPDPIEEGGLLVIAGGTNNLGFGGLVLNNSPAPASAWLTGGALIATNNESGFMDDSEPTNGVTIFYGSLTQSNGVLETVSETLGSTTAVLINDIEQTVAGNGTLTIAGGIHIVGLVGGTHIAGLGEVELAKVLNSTGTVWVTGGQLEMDGVVIGLAGAGQMTMSNGNWQAVGVSVGAASGGNGTLTVAGGTSAVSSNLTIGTPDCTGVGTVIVNGGGLFVTNAAHNAVLDLESGTLTLSSGTLVVDVLVTNNPCGVFQQTGGTLVVGGVTNIVTVLPFSITSITSDGHSISIAWQTPGGVTNIVQATNGNPDGSYNTNFVDLSPPLPITVPGTNQYNDIGGATNTPARYYRVRRAM